MHQKIYFFFRKLLKENNFIIDLDIPIIPHAETDSEYKKWEWAVQKREISNLQKRCGSTKESKLKDYFWNQDLNEA